MQTPTPEQRARIQQLETDLKTAVALHEAGRLAEARPLYEGVIKVLPRHPETRHLYGTLLHQMTEHGDAVDHLRNAIALHATKAPYHNHLGAALLALGEFEEAEAALSEAIRLDPAYAEAHINLSITLLRQRRNEVRPRACPSGR